MEEETERSEEQTVKGTESVEESCHQSKKQEPFKKPQFIVGPQRGKHVKDKKSYKLLKEPDKMLVNPYINEDKNSATVESKEGTGSVAESKDSKVSKIPRPPLPYKEPSWGGTPLHEYKLEILKSGTIVQTVDLTKYSFHVLGRLEVCDIPMLHPTVSRYHCVLQYRLEGDSEDGPGFYVYDLDSSAGTFLNKKRIKPKTFVRVKVGHVLKLASSTKMLILHGPEDDEEPESDLTVTELKKQYQEKLLAMEAEKERLQAEEEERIKREEERGIDWGMGEDADEETDLTENPYATTQNEELYLDDPKKTLRGWFEREGEELVYDVEEKNFGHFVCRIELPVDNGGGGNLVAEASVKGKKKEAVVQAALEACRLLDRQGLLRQATHESKKKASKDWEAVDFYDSDEDNFLDRTGQIEKKRQQRMAQSGKLEQTVETYDTLMEKYTATVNELERSERKLNEMLRLATKVGTQPQDEDDLDAYMNSLMQGPSDKLEIKKMKDEVARLRAEEGRVRNLVNIARPTELPKLEPVVFQKDKKVELPHGMIGKKLVKKRPHQERVLPLETTQQRTESESVEEFDEDEEKPEKSETDVDSQNTEEIVKKKKKSRQDTRNRGPRKQPPPIQMDDEDYSNCMWKPPVGQTGDGRTSLNDKFGY